MTRIYTPLRLEYIDNRWKRLLLEFEAYSDVLEKYGLDPRLVILSGFIQDGESIPFVRGSSERSGLIHDFVSRIGAVLGITKAIAAEVYREFLHYCDDIDEERFKESNHPWIPDGLVVPIVTFDDWVKRWIKWSVVRVWPGYWQRFKVDATPEEILGIKEDPYITREKLDKLVAQTEEMTENIKELPIPVQEELLHEVEDVSTELKEEKEKLKD